MSTKITKTEIKKMKLNRNIGGKSGGGMTKAHKMTKINILKLKI